MTRNTSSAINIIIIGAGAISQEWHIPILMGRSDFNVVGLVDKSSLTCSLLNKAYPKLKTYSDISEINLEDFDAAVVATPVAFHYQITKYLLQSGKHVLVEKPVAINLTQVNELVSIADENNLILSVSLYRRLYPSLGILKSLIKSNIWGEVTNFTFNWGDSYSWNASSLGNMQKDLAGGGVLMDLGPHAIDWLCELFGHTVELEEYRDDAHSGIETDCSLKLRFTNEKIIQGTLSLSRIRKLGGEITIKCEAADLVLSVGERFKVKVVPHCQNHTEENSELVYFCSDDNLISEEWFETFAREHDDFINAIKDKHQHKLSARSVLAATKIIDECYSQKQFLNFEWNNTGYLNLPDLSGVKSVFITGASGFIGGRLVEILAERTDIVIYAAVNNPNKATRLSRYNVNMIKFDLNKIDDIEHILKKVDAVVHCAIGTAYGDDASIYKTTVEGTANLLYAAEKNNVKKFLHLSSLATINTDHDNNVINEDNCTFSARNDIYTISKLAAEKTVNKHSQDSKMQITIFRPTNVYGPYSPLFSVGSGKEAIRKGLILGDKDSESPSNTVFIDNLIVCMITWLGNENKGLSTYFINDDDDSTYYSFYKFFTEKFGKELLITKSYNENKPEALKSTFSLIIAEINDILKSKELRKFALKIYNSRKIGFPARWLVSRLSFIESKLRNQSGKIYKRKCNIPKLASIKPTTSSLVEMKKFREQFSVYKPVERKKAMQMTLSWIYFFNNIRDE